VSRGTAPISLEFAIFALAALPIVSLLAYWSRSEETWLIILSIIMGWVLTVAFTALFSDGTFSNAYPSSLILVRVVFRSCCDSPFWHICRCTCCVNPDGYHLIAHQEAGCGNFFALTAVGRSVHVIHLDVRPRRQHQKR